MSHIGYECGHNTSYKAWAVLLPWASLLSPDVGPFVDV